MSLLVTTCTVVCRQGQSTYRPLTQVTRSSASSTGPDWARLSSTERTGRYRRGDGSASTLGAAVTAGKPFGEIESVKAVFDLYAPVTGTVAEVNAALATDPSPINADCYGAGWMLKIALAPGATLDHLMTKDKR